MTRRFTKIKFKGGKVILAWEQINKAGDWDTYGMESTEAPAPSLDFALQGLRRPLLVETELSSLEPVEFTIGSVSLSYSEVEEVGTVRGAVISAVRALKNSNSPMVVNSPYKPEKPFTPDGDESVCLDGDTIEAIDLLIVQAEKYLDGDRAQTDLFRDTHKKDVA